MRTVAEDIVKSNPINKTASLVVSEGIAYDPDLGYINEHSENPINTLKTPSTIKDYTGQKFGRFTVVGLRRIKTDNRNSKVWTVRCDCGNYETRKTKAIRNKKNIDDCCVQCRQTKYLRRHEEYIRSTPPQKDRR